MICKFTFNNLIYYHENISSIHGYFSRFTLLLTNANLSLIGSLFKVTIIFSKLYDASLFFIELHLFIPFSLKFKHQIEHPI